MSEASGLPQELLDEIISYVSHVDLPSLALVSKNIQSISYNRIYRDLPAVRPRNTVLLLNLLAKRPDIAAIVRTCTISDIKAYGLVTWTISFYQLMSKALHNMLNLLDLRLYLIGPYAKYLAGCSFKLTSLRIACDWNEDLVEWLREQGSILDIWVFSLRHTPGLQVAPSILPSLNRALGSVVALSALVPERPVHAADVSFPTPDGFTADILGLTCKVLSHSTGPLAELFVTADLTDLEAPRVVEALEAIPPSLPDLQSFGLFAARGFVNATLVNSFSEVLSKFKKLKKASIYSAQLNDALSDYLVTKDLPVQWHQACPGLESVDINGVPWMYIAGEGWMTTETCKLRMLDMLSQARKEEQRLRRRLGEVQNQNRSIPRGQT